MQSALFPDLTPFPPTQPSSSLPVRQVQDVLIKRSTLKPRRESQDYRPKLILRHVGLHVVEARGSNHDVVLLPRDPVIERQVPRISWVRLVQSDTAVMTPEGFAIPGQAKSSGTGTAIRFPSDVDAVDEFLASFAQRGLGMRRTAADLARFRVHHRNSRSPFRFACLDVLDELPPPWSR